MDHVRQPKRGSGYEAMSKATSAPANTRKSGGDAYKPPHLGGFNKGKGYETHPHGGKGTSQNPGWGAGKGRNSTTPHAERVPHAGQGAQGKGYDTKAHTMAHHGKRGQASGVQGSLRPMEYDTKLQGEGAGRITDSGGGPTHVATYSHKLAMKAHHHPPANGDAHRFDRPPANQAHGYGHPAHLRQGHHRLSGHKMAHRIGPRNTDAKCK